MNTYIVITSEGLVVVVCKNSMYELTKYLEEEGIVPSVIKVN